MRNLNKNNEANTAIKSISVDIRNLVSECRNCPRRDSQDTFIQCPLFYPSRERDDVFFEAQSKILSERRAKHFQKPIRENYNSEGEYLQELELWEWHCFIAPDSLREDLIKKVGEKHLSNGERKICKSQERVVSGLNSKIHYFNQPLFQRDLYSIEADIKELKQSLNNEDWQILDNLGLKGFLHFVDVQISRAWRIKIDTLNYLIAKEGYGSLANLLSHYLNLASLLVQKSIRTRHGIPKTDYYCFYFLWWLLRRSSCFLTFAFIDKNDETDKHVLLESLEGFISSYESLALSPKAVVFEAVFNYHQVDLPEEIESRGTSFLGCYLSDYNWFNYENSVFCWEAIDGSEGEDTTYSYIMKTPKDSFQNPSSPHNLSDNFWGLSRGAYHSSNSVLDDCDSFGFSNEDESIEHYVYAVDHLYSLNNYCKDLHALLNKKNDIAPSFSPLLLYNKKFDQLPVQVPPHVHGEFCGITGITSFDTIVYNGISTSFREALLSIENGHMKKGEELLKLSAEHNDLNSIVFLANLYAFGTKPNYDKALSLYEKAVSYGVRFCIYNVAQCHELLRNYRLAFWWYSLLKYDKNIDQKELNLRLGNCSYHMGETKCHYFESAGERGAAARYILGLYGDYSSDFNEYKAFSEALKSLINEVQPRLGYFSDLYTHVELDGELTGMRPKEREKLKNDAQKGDPHAQYIIGLCELKEYLSSVASQFVCLGPGLQFKERSKLRLFR